MFEKSLLIAFTVLFSVATFFNWLFLFPALCFSCGLLFFVYHSLTSPIHARFKDLTERIAKIEDTVSRLSMKKL